MSDDPSLNGRPQTEWILDECSCGHIRLNHLTPENSGGSGSDREECRNLGCVAFVGDAVDSKCKKFRVAALYNKLTNECDPL